MSPCTVHRGSLFTTQSRLLTSLYKKPFENIVGKRENAGNQHFLRFQQCFLRFRKQISIFSVTFILSSANAFSLEQSKYLLFGKHGPKLTFNAVCLFPKQALVFTCLQFKSFENTVEKGEIA